MKAALINRYGGSEVVEIASDVVEPKTAEGKVLIEVHAAGVNPIDWKIRDGMMQKMMPVTFPFTLGFDVSGIVKECGSGAAGFKKGDEVYGTAGVLTGGSGSFAEVVLARAAGLAYKPKNIPHAEAAALPLAGVSAVEALTEHMNLASGQRILIHGGAGGIGSFAIQLAKHLGANVITTARAEDAAFVQSLGADEVIEYTTQSFDTMLHDLDAVFDTVGGETYTRSFAVLKKGGILVSMLNRPTEELLGEQYGVREVSQFTKITSERLATVAELVEQSALTVHIAKMFPLDEAAAALDTQQNGHVNGKIVIDVKKD